MHNLPVHVVAVDAGLLKSLARLVASRDGVAHAEVGAYLLELWDFPDEEIVCSNGQRLSIWS